MASGPKLTTKTTSHSRPTPLGSARPGWTRPDENEHTIAHHQHRIISIILGRAIIKPRRLCRATRLKKSESRLGARPHALASPRVLRWRLAVARVRRDHIGLPTREPSASLLVCLRDECDARDDEARPLQWGPSRPFAGLRQRNNLVGATSNQNRGRTSRGPGFGRCWPNGRGERKEGGSG